MADATFVTERQATGIKFEVRPASASYPIGYLIFVVPVLFAAPFLLGQFGVFISLVIVLILLWVYVRSHRHRGVQYFVVSAAGIDVGGTTLPADKIGRLALRNHMLGHSVHTALDGRLLQGRHVGVAASAAARKNWDRKMSFTSWRLEAEVGGKGYTLGNGMDEITARDLAQAVSEAMQARVPAES